MKKLIFILIYLLSFSSLGYAQFHWPISNSSLQNSDRLTSPFGPRPVSGYQIHYGLDLTDQGGGFVGDNVHAPTNGTVVDIENAGGSTGWVLTFEVYNNGQYEYLLFFHSNFDPAINYWGIGDNVPLGSPIYEMGDGNGTYDDGPHLHLSYVPEQYFSTANGEVLDDYRYTSANPMSVFNYNSYTNYDVTNLELESDGTDAWLRFDVKTDPEAIDINEVAVRFEAATVEGSIAYQDNSSYGALLDGVEGYQTLGGETFYQELGRVDFEERVGYDFGPRSFNSNDSTFNGVKIIPGNYSNSNQSHDHSYTFKFRLDDDVIEHVIGGMQNIIVDVYNSDNAINYNSYSSFSETVNDVVWTQNWPYDTDFTWADSFEDIRVKDNGKILILNQNSSKTTQATLPSNFTLRIQDGGKFETEAGAGIGSRTYFTTQGGFYVEDGGQIVLNENSWFTVDGQNGYFEASFNSMEPIVGDGAEFFGTNDARYKFKKHISLNSSETCIAVGSGASVIFENGASFSGGSFLAGMSSGDGTIEINGTLSLDGPGNNDGFAMDLRPGTTVKMGENAKIAVKPGAKMRAQGTQQYPVRFIRADPNEAWGTIYLNSSEGNSIKWALFDGGETNLTIASQNNTIEHSTFRNATFRNIDSWHNQDGSSTSSATLSHVLIEDGATVGLVAQFIDLDISHTTIQNNSQAGMYITSASVYPFHRNEVINNGGSTRDGVEVMSSGTFYMQDSNLYEGYNEISNNGRHQISGSGDVIAGTVYPGMGGKNSVHGNYSGSNFLVKNNSSTSIKAQDIWWGESSTDPAMFDGPVNTSYFILGSDPTTGENPGSGGQTPAKALPGKEGEELPLAEVYDQLESELETAETEQQIRDGLHSLYQVSWLAKQEVPELSGRFRQLARQAGEGKNPLYESADHNQTLQHTATLLYAKSFFRDGEYENADSWLRETDDLSLEGNDRRDRLHLEMDLHRYNGNIDAAMETLQDLYAHEESRGVDIESVKRSYQPIQDDMVRRMSGDGSVDPDRTKEAADLSSTKDLTLQNYPNPFNPTTQIRFTLPEQSQVSLVVYDMLGREVARLVNEMLPAGEQTVRFDASNLANGVYIYRIQANQQERVRMMTLIK